MSFLSKTGSGSRRLSAALLCSTAIAAPFAVAEAQETPTAAEAVPQGPDGAGEIVVTGIRRANSNAIRTKRQSVNIVDVIGSTDVQALPDTTIVEALRRVPGLSVLPVGDNEHGRDEAASPVIRGLGPVYNNVTIDGMQIASPGTPQGTDGSTSRGVRLDILPSSMISELQVVKTFTPDLDANAIGGAINLKTRSAFDNGGRTFATFEGAIGHPSDVGLPRGQSEVGPRLVATASTTFGAAHQFGIALAANYQKLDSYTDAHMTTDTAYYDYYDASGKLVNNGGSTATAGFGNGYAVAQQDKYWYVQDQRSRYGLTGKLEARPSDVLYLFVEGGFYYFHDRETRNEAILNPNDTSRVFDQTATSGRYPVGDVELGWAQLDTLSRTRIGLGGFDWKPDDRQSLNARISYSSATYDETLDYFKYNAKITRSAPGTANTKTVATADYGFDYTSGFNQSFAMKPAAYNNLSNYSLSYWRPDGRRDIGNMVLQGKLDYSFNQQPGDDGFGFAAGASYTEDRFRFAVNRTQFVPNTRAGTLSLADAIGPINAPLRYNSAGLDLLTIDPVKALAQVLAQPPGALNQTDTLAFNNQDNFRHQEKIAAGYVLASYKSDAIDARAGVRLDHTDQTTTSTILASGTYRPLPTDSSYRFFLPSALLTYHATPTIDLRGALSQTIGRPGYDAYAARSQITFQQDSDIGNGAANNVSVSVGNPDIKPRLSTNYDLAADWQFDNTYGGILSLALFDKQIRDEIFASTSIGYTSSDGTFYQNAQVTQPLNAAKSHVRGVELNAIVNSLGFLDPAVKAFGISGNIAYMRGGVDVVMSDRSVRRVGGLVGQPDYTGNASLFYIQHGLELRAAYNRQGRSVRAINTTAAWQDLYWAPRQQVDLSATYHLTHSAAVMVQASNVTHERIVSLVGPNRDLLKDSYSVPTTYWLSLRFTPKF
nr:TonB dependent receptor [uncultured organism]